MLDNRKPPLNQLGAAVRAGTREVGDCYHAETLSADHVRHETTITQEGV